MKQILPSKHRSFGRGRLAAPLAIAFVASVLVLLAPSSSVALTTADIGSDPGGPLTHIWITSQLNCQVAHTGDTSYELYQPSSTTGDCGTFLVVDPAIQGGTLYGPLDCVACDATGPRTPWTEISQTQNGNSVVTVADAGTTGIRVTETDSYTPGQESFLTAIAIQNLSDFTHTLILYRAGDCFLGNDDHGFGKTFAGGGIACATTTDPNSRIEEWIPITIGSHYYETSYNSLWAGIGAHADFPDTCDCSIFEDNGAGLSWSTTVLAGQSAAFSHLTNFSPTGNVVLTMTKTADSSTVAPGAQDGYTITVNNPNASAVTLNSVTDDLPAGFSYVPGSTTGMTTADPTIQGQTLTWNGSFPIPGGGNASLHFNVVVAETPGEYLNQASATAEGFSVAPTGPTAPITVTGTPQPQADLSITKSDGNPNPCPGNPPVACGPDPVSSGQPVAYGISVTNNGPDPATGITVTDTPSAGATAQSGFGTNWTCDPVVNNTLTCHYGLTLNSGQTAEPLTAVVKAPTSTTDTTMTDQASVSADQPDPNPENNTATESTTVTGSGSSNAKDHAAGFFDNINTLTIATTRDQTGKFYSSLTIHPDPGLKPGVVTIDEFLSTQPPYNTLCGNRPCDAQVQVSGVPTGQAAANNAMEIHWFYVKDTKQGTTIWVKGDNETFGTIVKNCIIKGIANPPKCVNSKTILRNGDRDIMLLWRDGGDPWGGKR